jgi:5-deoxy-glucuronate isomerase
MSTWFHPRGSLSTGAWQTVVDDSIDGWRHTGLRIGELGADGLQLPAAPVERIVVPLAGTAGGVVLVREGGAVVDLAGRASVFDGPADVAYLPAGESAALRGAGRVAVAESPTEAARGFQVIRAADIPVEIRGAGRSTRQVHNFGTPGSAPSLDAARLIVCEVITPAENWSSYPPHKHDEDVPGVESELEEIYYFETEVSRGVDAPERAEPFGLFATYSSGRPIRIDEIVRTGDVALVPHGYHGPAVAAPGYDLYYLNVMAGPAEDRAWRIADDPAHGWVRASWDGQEPDPRLPYEGDVR